MVNVVPPIPYRCSKAFTLIELLVVLAIVALMLSVALPRYFHGVDKAKEATLKHDLSVMRESIDKFYGDQGRYPGSLEELVQRKYIRAIPPDPLTDSSSTWVVVEPDPPLVGGVYDVHSGAPGQAMNGTRYAEW